MTSDEAKSLLAHLCAQAKAVNEIAKTAKRNGKSLQGDNFYGNKFHDAITAVSGTLARLSPTFDLLTDPNSVDAVEAVIKACNLLAYFSTDKSSRLKAMQSLELACHSTLLPALENLHTPAIPHTEQVLLASVTKGTRGYLEKMILQANGNYEHGWFDAASVMIRKFVETLIIEVYEHHGRATAIKSQKDNNFFMLSDLVDSIVSDSAFNLARETKATLPLVKLLGDRSAHNRRYLATRPDIDKILPGLRVLADDLLHLAGLK